jgi:hypothetical protein
MSEGKIEQCQPQVLASLTQIQWQVKITYTTLCYNMRRHIPKEYKEIALHISLHKNITDKDIHRYTGISERAMKHLRKNYRETGEVTQTPVCPGRPRLLDSLEADVSGVLVTLYFVSKLLPSF